MMCVFFFFFFKQKTAYEMRISDWSSDVCSSDLTQHFEHCGSRLIALVRWSRTGAFNRLFDRIDRQHPKADRLAALQLHIDQAARAFSGTIIEVRRVTAYHRTQSDDAAETAVKPTISNPRETVRTGRPNKSAQ